MIYICICIYIDMYTCMYAHINMLISAQDNFPLPHLGKVLTSLREDLLNGKGFILFKRFPAQQWGAHKNAVAYMGLGTYLGYFISQNGRGHVLGHVKDVGDDPTQIDRVRIYRTTARQFFHADPGDIVGLLCVHRAQEGGESDIVSVHHVWNTLRAEHPEAAELLASPVWYFDRKGEVSDGEEEWIKTSVFFLEPRGKGRVYCKWDPYFVKSLTRFSDKGVIPPLSEAQWHALTLLEDTCQRLALHMVLEVGDIQFLSDAHVLHARTAYTGTFSASLFLGGLHIPSPPPFLSATMRGSARDESHMSCIRWIRTDCVLS